MTVLLDANVLVAGVVQNHVHHAATQAWFADIDGFATCPITQGSLVRLLVREDRPGSVIAAVLATLADHPKHEFWPDLLPYSEIAVTTLMGRRRVTDAYLAQLARHHRGRLATFDQGLAAAHPDVAELVPRGA